MAINKFKEGSWMYLNHKRTRALEKPWGQEPQPKRKLNDVAGYFANTVWTSFTAMTSLLLCFLASPSNLSKGKAKPPHQTRSNSHLLATCSLQYKTTEQPAGSCSCFCRWWQKMHLTAILQLTQIIFLQCTKHYWSIFVGRLSLHSLQGSTLLILN